MSNIENTPPEAEQSEAKQPEAKNKVLFSVDEQDVAQVVLNHPEKHNAFDDQIITQLTEIFTQINSNKNIKAMVLASTGKSFSAGADLAWMKRMAEYSYQDNLTDANALAIMLNLLDTLSVPTIAKVQGAAFGGAVGLVSCCDVAIASERASFCLSEVKLGLIPATISPYVINSMGSKASRRYFLTAERFTSHTAEKLGLVSIVCPSDELDANVNGIVNTIIKNSPAAVKEAKSLILETANKEITPELMNDTSVRIAKIRVSKEGQEGLTAFFENRKPNWQKD